MSTDYLNKNGLSYFWSKIKAWCNATFAAIIHNHASNAVNAMTGYSKPNSTSAIATSDTLNQAIGKLEKAIDDVDISNVVHKTGDEFIQGIKTFSNAHTWITDGVATLSSIQIQSPYLERTVTPANAGFSGLILLDKNANGIDMDYSSRLAALEFSKYQNGNSFVRLKAYNPTILGNSFEGISVGYDENNTPYSTAPSTSSDRTFGDDILTRDWIPKDTRIVHTTGDETISGLKYFQNRLFRKSSGVGYGLSLVDESVTKGTAPSSDRYFGIDCYGSGFDSYTKRIGMFECRYNTDRTSVAGIYAHKCDSATNSSAASISVYYPPSGDPYTSAPTPPANDDSSKIATTEWVHDNALMLSGSQTITGSKTFSTSSSLLMPFKSNAVQRNTNVSSTATCGFSFAEKDNVNISLVEGFVYPSKNTGISFLTRKWASTSSTFRGVQLIWQNNDDIFLRPADANLDNIYLGGSSYRWKAVYSANGSIQTSDERMKSEIGFIPDAVLDAWADVDFCQFKFNAAVGREGREAARFHTGVVAQKVQKAFSGAGLDASRYGLFCYDRWDAEPEQLREDGTVLQSAREAGDMYSMRYEEALCMEAAYMRRENARLKKRVADLEERLAALELKIS